MQRLAPKTARAATAAPAIGATPRLPAVAAQTFTVDSAADTHDATPGDGVCKDASDNCTLRAAIEEANADTGSTQINVPANMTILLDSANGALTPTASMSISGGGSTTVVDGQNATQVFHIDDSTTTPAVAVSNLTVQNGNGSDGGNIYAEYAALTLTNVLVKGGQASYGGGIYSDYYATLWLAGSTVDSNNASDYGGGMYLDGSAFVTDSTVSNNTADPSSYSYGGGIYISSGQVTLDSTTVSGNTSGYEGGGIYTDEVLRMTGGSLSGNKSDGGTSRSAYGAAIENDYTASLTGVTIADNTANGTYVEGGAIYNSGAFSLVNSSITGTTSTVGSDDSIDGGVISNDGENFTMQGGSISGTTNGVAGTPAYIYGGVLYSYEPSTLTGVSISDTTNHGDDNYVEGGVVYSEEYSFNASSTSVANTTNTSDEIYGGVFYLDNNSTLLNNSVKATTNNFGSYLEGGVLYNNYYLNLNGLTVDGTSSTSPASAEGGVYGGVISNDGDNSNFQSVSMTNTNVSVAGQHSYVYGGAFYNDYPSTVDWMQAIGTTVSADDYVYGGLLSNYGDHMTINNSTFAKATVTVTGANSASDKELYGSAAYIYYGTNMVNVTFADVTATVPAVPGYDTSTIDLDDNANFTNVTVANNTISGADDAALMHSGIWYDTTDYTASFKNTIVSDTPVANECGIDGGTAGLVSAGYNIENGTTCGFTNIGDQQSTDPKVAAVADNGGPVQTAALVPFGSPAIDHGTSNGAPATDARGIARPQGAGVDIGAYEYVPPGNRPNNPPSGPGGGGSGGRPSESGYRFVGSDGGVFAFHAPYFGSLGNTQLTSSIVGMATDSATGGYWLAASDGRVFSFNAPSYGSMGGIALDEPIVGIAAAPSGNGYWLVASDGGVFAFGPGAHFYGSTGNVNLKEPVVGMSVDRATGGYWLVASDGGVFSFHAPFKGSTGGVPLNQPVVGMAASWTGTGYWLVASDGGIFAFNVPFYGSTGGVSLSKPVVGMAADMATGGYRMVASDGGLFAFHSSFMGSTAGRTLARPIVGMASGA